MMSRYFKQMLAVASVIVTAGAATVSGLAAASASPAVRPSVSGTEHFQIVTASATAAKVAIIAHGPVFTAGGVDNQGNTTDTVKFPGGTFKIKHSAGHGPQKFNPTTCLITISQHGTYTLSGGTGKFAGISGHGKYQLRILGIAARSANGKCSQKKAPVAFQQVIQAQGPVHL
jgi:hypothetical protein